MVFGKDCVLNENPPLPLVSSPHSSREPSDPVVCHLSGNRVLFQNSHVLVDLWAFILSKLHKNCITQCMCNIFWVEFQRYLLKFQKNIFHNKNLAYISKDVYFIQRLKLKDSWIFFTVFETIPRTQLIYLLKCHEISGNINSHSE